MENAERFADERRTVARLAEVDRLKGEFVSTVSHELRTPLTAILGMGLTVEQQWERMSDATRREFVARLNANAAALEEVVGTLLDFSRIDSGRLKIRPAAVRVDTLVAGVASRLAGLLDSHAVSVDVEEGLTVSGDRVLLERVVENLLSNAVKYTPAGTPIEVSARREDTVAVIAVADRGPGIAREDLRHIGDRFFRGGDPNTRKTRGTGLGLALVREILDLHGSELGVSSEPGLGSRFWFRLPLAPPERLPIPGVSAGVTPG
jgi:signal transduction histidine kinase